MREEQRPLPRRKACDACVRAKRRCDLSNPCKRCIDKKLSCVYKQLPPSPTTSTSTSTAQPTPETNTAITDTDTLPDSGMIIDDSGNLGNTNDWILPFVNNVFQDAGLDFPQLSTSSELEFTIPPLPLDVSTLICDVPVSTEMDRDRLLYTTHQFRSYPEKLVSQGHTSFIHQHLYDRDIPSCIQDVFGACALYCSKRTGNYNSVMWRIIEGYISRLIAEEAREGRGSLKDHLARVQALILYQIIRLFDGDIRQRAMAESHEPILEAWTNNLRDRTVWDSNSSECHASNGGVTWEQWLFGESCRRTVITSIMLRGVYLMLRQGYCTLGSQVTVLSFSAHAGLWNAPNAYSWSKQFYGGDKKLEIRQMEFDPVVLGATSAEVDEFGLMMMVTYKGVEYTNEWLDRTGGKQLCFTEESLSSGNYLCMSSG